MNLIKIIKKTIKKGKFRNGFPFDIYFGKKKYYVKVRFDETWGYEIGERQDQKIKLFGFGAFPHHHVFSRRITCYYEPRLKAVLVYYYQYKFFKRTEKYLFSVGIGKEGMTTLDSYWISYELGAYFGGIVPAPHDVNFDIEIYECQTTI